MDKDIYYRFDLINKKDALFNFILGPRGCGKTIAAKKRMVDKGMDGKRFVYIRRKAVEIENKALENFFGKMQAAGIHEDKELSYKGHCFYCGERLIGYAIALSTAQNIRSVDYLNVTDVYFEEFVIERDPKCDYLPNEVFRFLELYHTIAREDDVKVWFLGNLIHFFNPYFLYFDIKPPREGIKKWKDYAVENWHSDRFEKAKAKTRFGRLIEGTPYGDFAVKNQSYDDNYDFICPRPNASAMFIGFKHAGDYYGIYRHKYANKYYVEAIKEQAFMRCAIKACTFDTDETPDIKMFKKYRSAGSEHARMLVLAIKNNQVFYRSEKEQEAFIAVAKQLYF